MSAATSMTAVESPSAYPESPMDGDDVVYPCKGCGEILEEGKAFELAGNRWHIDCFRCNSCGTLLDSDANLLLLGDGSLICNNCTYSCSACGNKIEDLAILTGDQAFCSSCFRCRNCKRKIENLRYARTSQGIFCMSCHESLMARRRKKARAAPKAPSSNGPGIEKALPSLPPDAAKGHSVGTPSDATSQSPRAPSVGTPPEMVTDARSPQEQRSPRERQTRSRNEGINAYTSFMRDASPTSEDARGVGVPDSAQRQAPKPTPEPGMDGPTLPASTYSDGKSRPTNLVSDNDDDESEGFLPMAFDPTPIAAPSVSRKPAPRQPEPSPPVQSQSENRAPRDYFGISGRLSARPQGSRDVPREDQRSASSRSASAEREREMDRLTPKASPHILSQDKGRIGSGRKRETSISTASANGSTVSPPVSASLQEKSQRLTPQPLTSDSPTPQQQDERLKSQQVPQHKKSVSKSAPDSLTLGSSIERAGVTDPSTNTPSSPVAVNPRNSGINPFEDPRRKENNPGASPPQPKNQLPLRADSLNAVAHRKQPSQDVTSTPTSHKRHPSASSVPTTLTDGKSTISRDNSRAKPADPSVTRSSLDALPPRSSSRPDASNRLNASDDFSTPRASPAPPSAGHRQHESISTLHSEDRRSLEAQSATDPRTAGLPKYTSEGNFSMEDEMGRILRGEKRDGNDAAGSSVLRRVSNAVKHNRSFSERESSRPGKSPVNGVVEISSPIQTGTPSITSPTPTNLSQDGIDQVRASLRRAQVQIAELETDKLSLQEQLNGSSEIKAVNTELREKRSTMAILDSQREMIVRELEIMTEHLAKAKDGRAPLDLGSLKTSILKEFAESLLNLKETMATQIEDLIRKRNELTEEITTLIQMKDKGFQEYESLSNRNTQLLQHNNDLVRNIQGVYQENRGTNGTGASNANGLGIYNGGGKGEASTTSEMRDFRVVTTDPSLPNLVQESDAEPVTVHNAPQVVNIRKGTKPTKFNWRKGGESLAKNVTKGIKGAFAADRLPPSREGGIGVPYNATHQVIGGTELGNNANIRLPTEDGRSGSSAGFGFFNQKNGASLRPGGLKDGNGSVASTDGSVLFGSELQARCDYENRVIPSIVSRCIQEVEARGMDVEGIYRKSGGAGQVKSVQQGFEKDHDHAISDPDLEIHAVTSALKQYFRKLPTPLIVYDVYESLLEAGQMTADRDKQVVALKLAVHDLPDAHRDCLQFLIQHLARVMAHDARNLMTALNLAVVFAPTIMRPLSIEREMTDMQTQRAAVQALLENHRSVFPE